MEAMKLKKLARYIEFIGNNLAAEIREIDSWEYINNHSQILQPENLPETGWKDFQVGQCWGGGKSLEAQHAWLRSSAVVPSEWKSEETWLFIDPGQGHYSGVAGAEALLFINGEPVQGIDDRHKYVLLKNSIYDSGDKEKILLYLRADSGRSGSQQIFKAAQWQRRPKKLNRLYFLAKNILSALTNLSPESREYNYLLSILDKAVNRVDMRDEKWGKFYTTAAAAADWLEKQLEDLHSDRNKEQKISPAPELTVFGHAHIDVAWLWGLKRTRAKCARSWATALKLIQEYDDFVFMQSSPQLYSFVQEDYPEMFSEIKKRAEKGSWIPAGGMWVEADTNITGGESLARQFLYGQKYFQEEFGSCSQLLWLPDVFGFTASLPQVARQAGIKYFATSKLSWNQFNVFPYNLFNWRGIDGSELLSYLLTTPEPGVDEEGNTVEIADENKSTYNSVLSAGSAQKTWERFKQKQQTQNVLMSAGWGDGGGGPTREMIENAGIISKLPGLSRVNFNSPERYMQNLEENIDKEELPVWDGELYLEYHRGTYTSQGWTKRYNRSCENLLPALEKLYTRLFLEGEGVYPDKQLEKLWKTLLKNQFHDILPGSSITEVYEKAEAEYEEILARGNLLMCRGLTEITGFECCFQEELREGVKLIVFNPHTWSKSQVIYPGRAEFWHGYVMEDEQGNIHPVWTDGDWERARFRVKNIDPGEIRVYTVRSAAEQVEDQQNLFQFTPRKEFIINERENKFANELLAVEIAEDGRITSLYDREFNRELVAEGSYFNDLVVYEDKPRNYDAWNIDIYYRDKSYPVQELQSREIKLETPECLIINQKWRFMDSTIDQDVILRAGSRRIDFRTEVNWQQKQLLLRALFNTNIRSRRASYEIQFGSITRSAHSNTSYDKARFEVPGQRWMDLSQRDYGISLLADCKYGYNAESGTMGISLLKSAVKPDPRADKRRHYFTYSIYPHGGDWYESYVHEQARDLTHPLHWTLGNEIQDSTRSNKKSAARKRVEILGDFSAKSTDISAWKLSEEGKNLILRCYEYAGRRDQVDLSLPGWLQEKLDKIEEVNLLEESPEADELPENHWTYEAGNLTFEMQPYQLRNWKFVLT